MPRPAGPAGELIAAMVSLVCMKEILVATARLKHSSHIICRIALRACRFNHAATMATGNGPFIRKMRHLRRFGLR